MDSLAILSYVCTQYKEYRVGARQYSNRDIFSDLGFTFDNPPKDGLTLISEGYASKILRGIVKQYPGVSRRLLDPEVRRKIESTLNLPGLFNCSSGQEIDNLVTAALTNVAPARSIDDGQQQERSLRDGIDDFNLISLVETVSAEPLVWDGEIGCQRVLSQFLLRDGRGLVHWGAPPWSGASFVAHSLIFREDIKAAYRSVCIIRPTEFEDPYANQLERLAGHFGVEADKQDFPARLLALLRNEKILLILLDACYVPDQESFAKDRLVRRIIAHACSARQSDTVSHILTVGRSPVVRDAVGDVSTNRLNAILRVQPRRRFPLFHQLFDNYRDLRGNSRPEEGGSRIKRGRWHYEAIKDADGREVWPAMVRLRAFFASNFSNHSYFDPMQGFDELCGYEGTLPFSISMARHDVLAYLHRSLLRSQSSEVKALRLCSTAKHWLTRDALEVLRQPFRSRGGSNARVSELTFEAFEKVQRNPYCPISTIDRVHDNIGLEEGAEKVFGLSLGIKAIVQTEWFNSDPFERSVAHWRVAERLWKLQDDKDILGQEFPYLPHWGRSRIFILGECIRHLMASIRGVSMPKRGVPEIFERDFFPNAPTFELRGCDPNEVVNFCYARIFQREINGNRQFARARTTSQAVRALAKRHGAFEYAAELLQLLGSSGAFGNASAFLMPEYLESYLRECAFACLDIGELSRSDEIFSRLCFGSESGRETVYEDELNLSLVATERNEIERARDLIESAKAREESITRAHTGVLGGSPTFRRRLATREAHIAAVTGNPQDAIRLSKEVFALEADPQRWDAELLQNYIRSLGNIESQRSEALRECLAATFRASGAGFQHEALGYRVLLGRIFRQRSEVAIAEQILDDAQQNILTFGCSERAYLEFLYEAGRTLCAMEEPFKIVRAFSSYLRPCLVRARSRRYGRYESLAEKYSELALRRISEAMTSASVISWETVIERALQDEVKHAAKEKINREGFFEVDPLFGYYVSGSQEIINRLRYNEGVQAELSFVLRNPQ